MIQYGPSPWKAVGMTEKLMKRHGVLALTLALIASGAATHASEPVIGGPCEGCELVFVDMPESIASEARIAPSDQPGEPLRITGVVTNDNGTPAADVIVYAYHTDAEGVYPRAETRHGGLRGWARTDNAGRYRFDTIRPASYPRTTIRQHVHMHVIEPDYATYWISDIVFDDDPYLDDREKKRAANGRGGSGLVEPRRDDDGVWHVRRDIVLGQGVPGYRE